MYATKKDTNRIIGSRRSKPANKLAKLLLDDALVNQSIIPPIINTSQSNISNDNKDKLATKQPHPNALIAVGAFAMFVAYLKPQAPAMIAITVAQAISVAISDSSRD